MTIRMAWADKKYKDRWIGLKDDQRTVVASGKTPIEVLKKSRASGVQDPILLKVPSENCSYVL